MLVSIDSGLQETVIRSSIADAKARWYYGGQRPDRWCEIEEICSTGLKGDRRWCDDMYRYETLQQASGTQVWRVGMGHNERCTSKNARCFQLSKNWETSMIDRIGQRLRYNKINRNDIPYPVPGS